MKDFALNVDYNCRCTSENGIKRLIFGAARRGVSRFNWRVSGIGRRYYRSRIMRTHPNLSLYQPTFDPLASAAKWAHSANAEIYAYVDLFDNRYCSIVEEHPEWCLSDRSHENTVNIPSYSHPEVRKFFLKEVKEIAKYDIDGIYFCTKSAHQTFYDRELEYGYEWPVVKEYKERYGIDITQEEFDRKKWREIQYEFLADFLKKSKIILNARNAKLGIAHPLARWQVKCLTMEANWRKLVELAAIDEIYLGCRRGEERAWFTPKRFSELPEYIDFCESHGVEFYCYIFADTYWTRLRKESGWEALSDHISNEIRLLNTTDIAGIVFHDLDIFLTKNWRVPYEGMSQAGFPQDDYTFWDEINFELMENVGKSLMSGEKGSLSSFTPEGEMIVAHEKNRDNLLGNPSFEMGLNCEGTPRFWQIRNSKWSDGKCGITHLLDDSTSLDKGVSLKLFRPQCGGLWSFPLDIQTNRNYLFSAALKSDMPDFSVLIKLSDYYAFHKPEYKHRKMRVSRTWCTHSLKDEWHERRGPGPRIVIIQPLTQKGNLWIDQCFYGEE